MLLPAIIFGVTVVLMIASILFFPRLRLWKGKSIGTYWAVCLAGAVAMTITGCIRLQDIFHSLSSDSAINPLKILILFLSMTLMSIYLDEAGFFAYLARKALAWAGSSTKKLFICLYALVAVLTVFTSNDIIILSFTPFICCFSKRAGIDAIPFLATEFVAANTWSMTLVIGNPTNIYIASSCGIEFWEYFRTMLFPTLAGGLVSLVCLYLLFRKSLKADFRASRQTDDSVSEIKDRAALIIGIIHLGVCTIGLAISSYIGIRMWTVAFFCLGSLCLCNGVKTLVREIITLSGNGGAQKARVSEGIFIRSLARAPWSLVPFLLSMFTMVLALDNCGITGRIAGIFEGLGDAGTVFSYGISSFLGANVLNNIPMSVLFCGIISQGSSSLQAIYATIAGSNLGAFFTPVGALAGIMWTGILRDYGLHFGYLDFLRTGLAVALPTLAATLGALCI